MGKSRKVALAGAMPSRKSRKVSQVEEKVSLATVTDSRLVAEKIFLTMIEPTTLYDFRARYWEKEPLVIKRSQPEHFSSWFSMDELDKLLRSGKLVFGRHIDITSYSLEEGRKTWNKEGVADADYVWGMFKKGCSMRLYHPQEFLDKFWHINACLQEHFGCLVGANIYVTPANSQGFSPHYDDVEVMVAQVEGSKVWQLHPERSDDDKLPLFSSGNFEQEEVGPPSQVINLEAGDFLYLPRGTIHQAKATDQPSMHITFSTYQQTTIGHFLSVALPRAIEVAMQDDPEFRQGLPLNYSDFLGVQHSDMTSSSVPFPAREGFMQRLPGLMKKLVEHIPVDAAADQMFSAYLSDALPPFCSSKELKKMGTGQRSEEEDPEDTEQPQPEVVEDGKGKKRKKRKKKAAAVDAAEPIGQGSPITSKSEVAFVRAGVARLVIDEEETCSVYHAGLNSRVHRENDIAPLRLPIECAEAIEALLASYPTFVAVSDLPTESQEEAIAVCTMMYEAGLLIQK